MKRTLCGLVVLASLAVPAYAQKITLDYASDFDFAKVRTFEYVDPKGNAAKDDLMDRRIREGIISRLTARGLKRVTESPDLFVTYRLITKENTVLTTTALGYGGWGPGWHTWGMPYGGMRYGGMPYGVATTTTEMSYSEGTLIVDAYEPLEKKIIWRGTGSATVKTGPEKQAKQIEKVLNKLGQRWAKILKKQGK